MFLAGTASEIITAIWTVFEIFLFQLLIYRKKQLKPLDVGIHMTRKKLRILPTSPTQGCVEKNLPEHSHQSGSSPFRLFLCRNRTRNYWKVVKCHEIRWASSWAVKNRTCTSGCTVDYFLKLNIFMQTCSRLNPLFCCWATDQSAPDLKCMAKFKTLVRANLWIIL